MYAATSPEVASKHTAVSSRPHPVLTALVTGLEVAGQVLLIAVGITFALLFPFFFARRPGASKGD